MHRYNSLYDPHLEEFYNRKIKFPHSFHSFSKRTNLYGSYNRDGKASGLQNAQDEGVKTIPIRPFTLYKVLVSTADVPSAGTAATVFITLKGEWGTYVRQKLKKSKKNTRNNPFYFRPGSTHTFYIISPDLGEIRSVLIEHNGTTKEDSWLLESVQVLHPLTRRRYMFMCNHWLSLYKEDGKLERELFGVRSQQTKYAILIVTGDQEGCGTDSNVFITLHGRTGITPRIELSQDLIRENDVNKSPFARGTSSKFVVNAPGIGALTKIRISQNASGRLPHWFLERVVVTDLSYPKWTYYFNCSFWLSPTYTDGRLSRLVRGFREPTGLGGEAEYRLTFYTADKPGAGTTADVFVQLHGETGTSRELWLNDRPWVNEHPKEPKASIWFSRGSRVRIRLPPCQQYGYLKRLTVGHNNRGESPSWFLDKVIVDELRHHRVFEFPCRDWIGTPRSKQLYCSSVRSKSGAEENWQKLPLEFHISTGELPDAGTTARVFIRVQGPEKTCRVNHYTRSPSRISSAASDSTSSLAKSVDSDCFNVEEPYTSPYIWLTEGPFERNQTATFRIDLSVPLCISPIAQLHVGHDNSGEAPSWFLDKIVVDCPTTGVQQTFVCNSWLSKAKSGGKVERTLHEDQTKRKMLQPKIPWILTVCTSDRAKAGTTSNVSIVFYGNHSKTKDLELTRTLLEDQTNWAPESVTSEEPLFQQGMEDVFRVNLEDIGVPYKLRVSHNNTGSNPSWHLHKIILSHLNNNEEEYTFPCNRWLSLTEDDGSLIRELPAVGIGIASSPPVLHYRIKLFTRTRAGLGICGKICINLIGDGGDTGDRWLAIPRDNEQGKNEEQMTEFIVEAVDLQVLKKIKVSHDGQRPGEGWYLSRVVVETTEDPTKNTIFECHRWLDPTAEGGGVVQELTASCAPESVNHTMALFTGSGGSFQPETNISLQLIGKRNEDSGRIYLMSFPELLPKVNEDLTNEFNFFAPDVGELNTIRLWSEGSPCSRSWFLDNLTLTFPHIGLRYVFDVHQWVYSGDSTNSASIELQPTRKDRVEQGIPYEIVVFTANEPTKNAEKGNISVQFYGTPLSQRSGVIPIALQPGNQVVRFKVYAENIGRLQKLHICWNEYSDKKRLIPSRILVRKPVASARSSSAFRKSKVTSKSKTESMDKHPVGYNGESKSSYDAPCPGLLDHFQMENYWFNFSEALMKVRDEDISVCEIGATTEDGRPLNKTAASLYEVLVKTGGDSKSGTSANVYITLYDTENASAELKLRRAASKAKPFQTNGMDKFAFTLIGLEELHKVKVRYDASGSNPDWYLEWILIKEVRTQGTQENLFPCYQWFSPNRDKGVVSIELAPASSDVLQSRKAGKDIKNETVILKTGRLATFRIRVLTGTEFGAGTNANVFIELFGENACTGVVQLSNSKDKHGRTKKTMFESGEVDIFSINTVDVGPVTKLRVGHDSSGAAAAWQLSQIEVESPALNKIWTFLCNHWFLPVARGYHVEAEFYPTEELTKSIRPTTMVEVKVYTSDISSSPGMTSKVFLQLFGQNGDTCAPVQLIDTKEKVSPFQPGAVDTFLVETEKISLPLQKIALWHDGSGAKPHWHVSRVEVKHIIPDDQTSESVVFPCENWFSNEKGDLALERVLSPPEAITEVLPQEEQVQPDLNLKRYEIHVVTGDDRYSGTDANVFLTLYGETGDSGERKLVDSRTHGNKFETGNTDIFHWEVDDIGTLYKARIRHDGTGSAASWYLSRIEVYPLDRETESTHNVTKGSESTVFYCNRWLSTQHDDCSIDRILYAHDYREPDSEISLRSSPNKLSATNPAYLLGTLLFPRMVSDKASSNALLAEEGTVATVPYHVRVVTGSMKHAGTPGPIWIRCVGKYTEETGKFLLFNEVRGTALRKGTTENFVFDAPAMDKLTEIEVGNESIHGTETGWFLRHVQVHPTHLDKCYQFNCHAWISRTRGDKKPTKRFAVLRDHVLSVQPLVTYHIKIATCDVNAAGTDSNIYIQFFGRHGVSHERRIEKNDQLFERASSTHLRVEFEDVGDLTKIRVRQDAQGERRHWKLDHVEVTKADQTYSFETIGGIWLSLKHGEQKRLWTDLVASVNGVKQMKNIDLKVLIKTSNLTGAGTDADIFIQLYGEHGDSGPWQLKECQNNSTPFKTNALDEFFLRDIPELGDLARCRVWLKPKGRHHSWHCAWVEVTELLPDNYPRLARHWRFECDNWLSLKDGERQTAVDIPCNEVFVNDPVRGHVNDSKELNTALAIAEVALLPDHSEAQPGDVVYAVEVYTGTRKHAETPNDAWLSLGGSRGSTRTLEINNSEEDPILQLGQSNQFKLFSPPVGALEKLTVGLIQRQERTLLPKPADVRNHESHWFCECVKVRDPISRRLYIFQVHKWIEAAKRHATLSKLTLDVSEVIEDPSLLELRSLQAKPIARYKVSVYTGSKFSGGTDANVYITLFSEQPGLCSGKRALKKDGRNLFERNQLDEFQIHCIDLGKITRLMIEHDNSSTRTDWFLEKVMITNMDTGVKVNFPCEQWLSRKRGDGRLWKELVPVFENS